MIPKDAIQSHPGTRFYFVSRKRLQDDSLNCPLTHLNVSMYSVSYELSETGTFLFSKGSLMVTKKGNRNFCCLLKNIILTSWFFGNHRKKNRNTIFIIIQSWITFLAFGTYLEVFLTWRFSLHMSSYWKFCIIQLIRLWGVLLEIFLCSNSLWSDYVIKWNQKKNFCLKIC